MKNRVWMRVLWVISSFSLGQAPAYSMEKPPLFLKLGEQRVLPLPPFERYSVSGSAIRYTRLPGENQLLIKAVSTGLSTILLTSNHQTTSQQVRVATKVDSPYPHSLLQSLSQLQTTETIDGGAQFILRGTVTNLKEARAIAFLKKHFPHFIADETEIESEWLRQSTQKISDLLKRYPHLKLFSQDGALVVQGNAPNEFILNALTKKIQSIQPLADLDLHTIKGFSPTLYFKVFLLEVMKKYSSRMGIEIAQPITGSISSLEAIAGNPVNYAIHAMTEKGMVKVLSAPELVVKCPGQAELFAGGEMPIRLLSRSDDKVVWKNVGLALKLDVKEYDGEKVRLSIETELNHLNDALTQNKIPGMQTNRIKTQVEGTMGKPLLLSGLLQEDSREKIRGIPGLSDIPVLGKLFGSEDFQKDRSELVAILLPYREPPREPMQRISSEVPKGYLPVSRNYISQSELDQAKASREFPWNVL